MTRSSGSRPPQPQSPDYDPRLPWTDPRTGQTYYPDPAQFQQSPQAPGYAGGVPAHPAAPGYDQYGAGQYGGGPYGGGQFGAAPQAPGPYGTPQQAGGHHSGGQQGAGHYGDPYAGQPGWPAAPEPQPLVGGPARDAYGREVYPYAEPPRYAEPAPAQPAQWSDLAAQAWDDPSLAQRAGSPYANAYANPYDTLDPVTAGRGVTGGRGAHTGDPALRGTLYDDWRDPHAQPGAGGYDTLRATDAYGQSFAQAGPPGAGAYAEPGYDAQGYPLAAGQPYAQPAGYGAAGQPVVAQGAYEDDEPERRPPRKWLMPLAAGVLVVTIAAGASLHYGYQILIGDSGRPGSGTPVVRGDGTPSRVRPEDPGGRQFANTDSKVLGRLGDRQAADDGTRRVSTLPIGRDGNVLEAPEAREPRTPQPVNPVVTVPGLTIVDGFAGRRAQDAGPGPQAGGPQAGRGPIVVTPPSAPPPETDATADARPSGPASGQRAPVVLTRTAVETEPTSAEPPPARKPPVRQATVTPEPAPPRAPVAASDPDPASSPPAATGSLGFVVVLGSVPVSATSRMDALKQYADLQQRYGSVLGGRTPDVREADLGAKGKYHRLLVGPPASKTSANELCTALKGAGYPSCWITPY
ncbi:MAG: SPOR domain-containing protein [Hyphomicrobiaceae bacterium]|nr:SPOR domain-containing protein [Hyphomicrobiaceae bacterium]